tara:strand:- start:44 stop:583 length:540 start_codon:yes stop_codon:yes gene_type:complete
MVSQKMVFTKKQKNKIAKEAKDTETESSPKVSVKTKETSAAELKDLLLRTQANFENFRKQTEKRIVEIREMASEQIIRKILPTLGNLELAIKNADAKKEDILKGVEIVHSQFQKVLSEAGIKAIETKNKQFDPRYHEALMKVASEKPENTIIEEFQKGFTLNGKIIQHARVKISAGKEE